MELPILLWAVVCLTMGVFMTLHLNAPNQPNGALKVLSVLSGKKISHAVTVGLSKEIRRDGFF